MAVLGIINSNDETAYREQVTRLADWCMVKILTSLNVNKTKEELERSL